MVYDARIKHVSLSSDGVDRRCALWGMHVKAAKIIIFEVYTRQSYFLPMPL